VFLSRYVGTYCIYSIIEQNVHILALELPETKDLALKPYWWVDAACVSPFPSELGDRTIVT
jgi:hypothetical protein